MRSSARDRCPPEAMVEDSAPIDQAAHLYADVSENRLDVLAHFQVHGSFVLTVPSGGTVLKIKSVENSRLSTVAEAVDQAKPSEQSILRLARLIGRQMARDDIKDRRSCASPEKETTPI